MVAKNEKAPLSWADYVVMLLVGAVVFGYGWKLLIAVGLLSQPVPTNPSVSDSKPKWSRNDCLNRWSYRIRQEDPMISDEMLAGDVARECVAERRIVEGW